MEAAADSRVIQVPLGEASLEIRRELWPVRELRLDPDNPRLTSLLPPSAHRRKPAQRELQRRLWNLPQVRALAKSILQNGGLLEDPLVRHDGTLVEGNCRTVALRALQREHPDDERFARIHVRVLPPDVTEVQIALLLGDLHIAQKIPWRGYDQAAYVWRMHRVHGASEEFLATHLRWSHDKLANKLAAYEETRSYEKRTGGSSAHERFPLFEELMNRPALRQRRARDPRFMEQFGRWIEEGRLTTAREVRELPDILADPDARGLFESAGAAAARELLDRRDPTRDSGLYWYVDRAAQKLESMPLQEVEAVRIGEAPRVELLRRLARALSRVEEVTGVQLEGS
ncbi:MAG: hypothetical protein ACRD2Z_14615 [Thermoanaerobaculia bacterium]